MVLPNYENTHIYGSTQFHYYVKKNQYGNVKEMMKNTDVNVLDSQRRTPLQVAALCGNVKIFKLLLPVSNLNNIDIFDEHVVHCNNINIIEIAINDPRFKEYFYKHCDELIPSQKYNDYLCKLILINNIKFDIDKIKSDKFKEMIELYKQEYYRAIWTIDVNPKLFFATKLYFYFNYKENECSFDNIIKKLPDDIKQLICCKLIGLNNEYIPTIFIKYFKEYYSKYYKLT